MKSKVEDYISIVPSANQLALQDLKFYAFLHYSINTFTGKEWGDGKESPMLFDPKMQDTDQWCETLVAAGMKGAILTCKHHDGFCLWQTQTTEHSIKNSPYKNGKGDVVKELADSCKKYGLKLGLYLSPWDRNSKFYGTEQYNDFYISQLTELLDGRYGEIFMVWLDGACGANLDGKPAQEYDFKRIWDTAKKLQPGICVANCGPDVRWVGNEAGVSRESEWNVVPQFQFGEFNMSEENQQKTDDMKKFQKDALDCMVQDLGSRKVLANYEHFMWYPAEVDVSIRKGWFYHKMQTYFGMKSLSHLMKIYYKAVGGNSLLLLNIPPDRNGLIDKHDVKLLKALGDEIKKQESLVIEKTKVQSSEDKLEYKIAFPLQSVDRLIIEEDTTFSQRVESFDIYKGEQLIYTGTVIGFGKIAIFNPIVTDNLRVVIKESRSTPHIRFIKVCATGSYRI